MARTKTGSVKRICSFFVFQILYSQFCFEKMYACHVSIPFLGVATSILVILYFCVLPPKEYHKDKISLLHIKNERLLPILNSIVWQ